MSYYYDMDVNIDIDTNKLLPKPVIIQNTIWKKLLILFICICNLIIIVVLIYLSLKYI